MTVDYNNIVFWKFCWKFNQLKNFGLIFFRDNFFDEHLSVEPWTMAERLIDLGERLTMRERRFGLLEIIDLKPDNNARIGQAVCRPGTDLATKEMVSSWLDLASINLNYICARTLLTSRSNMPLADQVIFFSG